MSMLILGIVLFALLVVLHEFGHFIVARRNGVEVEEFGIGFPPRLYGKKVRGTLFSINLIPLGGFVKQKGESDSDRRPGTFGATSFWVKAKILMAGVGMNIATAALLVLILALTQLPTMLPDQYQVPSDQTIVEEKLIAARIAESSPVRKAGIPEGSVIREIAGSPVRTQEDIRRIGKNHRHQEVEIRYSPPEHDEVRSSRVRLGNTRPGFLGTEMEDTEGEGVRVGAVLQNSAAEEIGIAEGDVIHSVAGQEVGSREELTELTSDRAGQITEVAYTSQGQRQVGEARFGTGGVIEGVNVFPVQTSRYTWAAPLVALGITVQMIGLILAVAWDALTGLIAGAGMQAADGLTGPVGIVVILQSIGNFGIPYLLFLIVNISAALGVFNALPIPALDGGRLAVIGGARVLRHQLPEKVENGIHGVGFLVLLSLIVLITYVDIQRFF